MVVTLTKKQRRSLNRIIAASILFAGAVLLTEFAVFPESYSLYAEFFLFLSVYLVIGGDVLLRAGKNIIHGNVFDEHFLMSIATIGAFCLGQYPEAVAVMLFYQVGELFQSYAVEKSRRSIADLMDISPDHAYIEQDGAIISVDPGILQVGDHIVIKAGDRVPVDGVVIAGMSALDTASLTGESLPRNVGVGDKVISGCINISGVLHVRVEKPLSESTVTRILELVENAAGKKAKTEQFITRFSRYYTPVVVLAAVILSVIPPLILAEPFTIWIERALIFLVVSCPCALVISVPLSFFGGIGGASRSGILVKGSSYLEALSKTDTIVFDKTGTLTNGSFSVTDIHPIGISERDLLEIAAHAETYSSHPIAVSLRVAYQQPVSTDNLTDVSEYAGHGVSAMYLGRRITVGNAGYLQEQGVTIDDGSKEGSLIHVAIDGRYAGWLRLADTIKPTAVQAVAELKRRGIHRIIMLTGDAPPAAAAIARELGIDEYYASLLPQDKVSALEKILAEQQVGRMAAFVGDGINDAPVIMRADLGIAMGSLGSDAAIEAADIVLMDDDPMKIISAVHISHKTMHIVFQNIVFALGVKFFVLLLAALGIANMWEAVFADVGVAFIAILNAMRTLKSR
ncbi:heavy metal translocating P-type ATPase [Methanocorpusculum labreanum Z]|uniref:Heavy metal translocating P-type ATPase n=1 Tax=Methanocorpusculum labreanum (strain ATCC 43576 / DSM 4855 / Z) TaxID=410358 RepID=A2SSC8_METLZ|nr:heavy metal translocating P-type ATPase [Methanocorpusculum labreanum]ABN07234.1 heavy metal translocating P-type ATPase [Methanocorpusculum labreanum Z]